MKFDVLEPDTITEATITTILDNGAIEYSDNNGIYVLGFPFNFWMDVDHNRKLIILYTYWLAQSDADEIDILRFVNDANGSKIMLQFSYNADLGRFYGYYTHPYHVGLLAPHVLKLCQKFSAIFEEVVHEGIAEGLLEELLTCPIDDDDAATGAASDSTVH